jgi:choline transport protein
VLKHPDFLVKQWHTWIIAEVCIALFTLFNIYGMGVSSFLSFAHARRQRGADLRLCVAQIMAILDKIALWWTLFTFLCYLIVPVACANPSFAPPTFVFKTFINETGYGPFVAFMVGLSGLTAAFGGTDAVSHVAEEIREPERNVPCSEFFVSALPPRALNSPQLPLSAV